MLLAALAGMFATSFPTTILAVSLGVMSDALGVGEASLSWLVSAPLLLAAVALPILGKLGDLLGHRRVFLAGFVIATVLSAASALAWDAPSLIVLRTLAAVTGAATQPSSLALILRVYEPRLRPRAIGWWSMVGAGAPAFGLVVGGPMIDLMGWRAVFVSQAVLSLFAVVFAWVVLEETTPRRVRFDVAGALVLAVGIGGIMAAISLFANDVRSPWPWLCLAAGALALWLFSRIERRAIEPILPASLLRLPNVALATSVDGLMGAAYMGAFVVAPIVLFEEFGFTVSAVALVMLLRTVSLAVTSPLGGRIAERFGLRAGSGVGAVSMWIAIVLLALGALEASLALFATGLILQGLGQGVARPSLVTAITAAVPEEHLGVVTAATRLARQGGAAVGITVMTQVYGNVGTPERFATSFGVGALFALGALVLVLRLRAP